MKNLLYILLFVPFALFGQDNYSLSFDGVDDYVEISNSLDFDLGDFTIIFKFKTPSITPNSLQGLVSKSCSGCEATLGDWFISYNHTDSGRVMLFTEKGGLDGFARTGTLALDTWYNIGVRRIESTGELFITSNIIGASTDTTVNESGAPTGIINNTESFVFGNMMTTASPYEFEGFIDDVSLWNFNMSYQTMKDYMSCSPSGFEQGLVGYWNFNEGQGNTLNDISGNENHGVINGATYTEDVSETCSILDQLNQSFDAWNVSIDLSAGWNMFGYGCPELIDVVVGLSNHTDKISLVKDNDGSVYIPEFSFDGIGNLTPGFGYQIKLTESIEGFSLCDWYVNDIPEDNIVLLQEDNISLQAELDCYENPQVGDYCFGGIVLYFNEPNNFGLIIGQEDLGYITWYEAVDTVSSYTIDDYSDWYLPSIEELEMISTIESSYFNFGSNFYWSSSEYNIPSNGVWTYNFSNSSVGDANKNNNNLVRPIRAFGNWTMGCMDETACNFNPEANMADGSCEYAEQLYDCDGNLTAEIEEPICGYLPTNIDIWPYVDINIPDGYTVHSVYADFDRPGYSGPTLDFSIAYCPNCDSFPAFIDNLSDFYIWEYETISYSLYDTELVISEVSEIELNGPGTIRVLAPLPNDGWNDFCINFELVYGCMDSLACNFNSEANMGDGSCEYSDLGYDCEGNSLITQDNIHVLVDAWLEDSLSVYAIYGHISDWDVSNVTDMSYLFYYAATFNGNILSWDVSNVTNIRSMFENASSFNQDISSWDVSNVSNMDSLFCAATSFNQDLSSWDVSNVTFTYMSETFYDAYSLSVENRCAIQTSFSTNPGWPYEWQCSLQVGDLAEGGIVFYVDETGEHGLVAAMEDLGIFEWGCSDLSLSGTNPHAIGTGYQNTLDIVAGCSETPTAASEVLAYEHSYFDDWYLPSQDELVEMYNTIGNAGSEGNLGGFSGEYWSSSAYFDDFLFVYTISYYDFDNGISSNIHPWGNEDITFKVRPIRSF